MLADGSVPMTGNINLGGGGRRITNGAAVVVSYYGDTDTGNYMYRDGSTLNFFGTSAGGNELKISADQIDVYAPINLNSQIISNGTFIGTVAGYATEPYVQGYAQPSNAALTKLALNDGGSVTNISFPTGWSFTWGTTNNFDEPIPLGFLPTDETFTRVMGWESTGTAWVDIIEYSTNGTTIIQTNYAGLVITPQGSTLTSFTNFANNTASQGNMLKASVTNWAGIGRGNLTIHSTYSN